MVNLKYSNYIFTKPLFQFRETDFMELFSSMYYQSAWSPWRCSGLVCWPLDPKVAGSKPGQGDGFLRAIKISSTPSSQMGSKAGRSHVVRFYSI
jgi:hypothetical protein